MSGRRRTMASAAAAGLVLVAMSCAAPTSAPPAASPAVTSATSTTITEGEVTGDAPTTPSDGEAETTSTTRPPRTRPSTTPRSLPLPAGPVAVVALGDSLTEGDRDDAELGGYPGRLPAALGAAGRPGSTVKNLGKSGWSSAQLLEPYAGEPAEVDAAIEAIDAAKAAGRPAIALVLIGSNDLWYLYMNEDPTTGDAEQENLVQYEANVRLIVERLTDAGAIVLLGINDDQSRRPVAADASMRREAFPDMTAGEVAAMSKQADSYAEIIRDIAADNDSRIVDFLHASLFTDPATLADDGNHPNAKGYDAMTAIWLAALEPVLG